MTKIVRLTYSHPDFEEFGRLQELILIATNPQMYFSEEPIDIPDVELVALKNTLLNKMQELINNYEELPIDIALFIDGLENEEFNNQDEIDLDFLF